MRSDQVLGPNLHTIVNIYREDSDSKPDDPPSPGFKAKQPLGEAVRGFGQDLQYRR